MQKRELSTKDLYLREALRLFSERGYEAVGVVDIAKAVGCTTSALYKHFKNKRELFEAILKKSEEGFKSNMSNLNVNFFQSEIDEDKILNMTVDEQVDMVKNLFVKVLDGEYPKLFRKLMTVEQFKNSELAKKYNEHYIDNQYKSFERLMEIWIQGKVMKDMGAKAMTIEYISPVILMFGVCDRTPERRDEVLEMLELHIRHFNKVYRI